MIFMIATSLNSQTRKGIIEFTLDGPLYSSTTISADGEHEYVNNFSPRIGFSRFVNDQVSMKIELMMVNIDSKSEALGRIRDAGIELSLGVNFHLPGKKWWPFLGPLITVQSGDLYNIGSDSPVFFGGQAGIKYWPMETGAIYSSLYYGKDFTTEAGIGQFTMNLGLIIRLK